MNPPFANHAEVLVFMEEQCARCAHRRLRARDHHGVASRCSVNVLARWAQGGNVPELVLRGDHVVCRSRADPPTPEQREAQRRAREHRAARLAGQQKLI